MKLDPSLRYDMPANFGPSVAPGVEAGYSMQGVSVPFVTDPDALAPLLPPHVHAPSRPIVSVSYNRCQGMTWMGGRDYNIVSVYASAVYDRGGRRIDAPLSLVIWESDAAPIIAGREYMGTPKLFAQIPDLDATQPALDFSCSEYGATLVEGSVRGMSPASAEDLSRVRRSGEEMVRLHWKYIPGPAGTVDADYLVAMYMASEYSQLWKGEGSISFGEPSPAQAPYSSRIVAALRSLPILEYRPATAYLAPAVSLFRDRTERLP